jgi:hypothetical protein
MANYCRAVTKSPRGTVGYQNARLYVKRPTIRIRIPGQDLDFLPIPDLGSPIQESERHRSIFSLKKSLFRTAMMRSSFDPGSGSCPAPPYGNSLVQMYLHEPHAILFLFGSRSPMPSAATCPPPCLPTCYVVIFPPTLFVHLSNGIVSFG